jgi:hypothetical protein
MSAESQRFGAIKVATWYNQQAAALHVHVLECMYLPKWDDDGFVNPFIRLMLLPDPSKETKRNTKVRRNTYCVLCRTHLRLYRPYCVLCRTHL